MRRNIIVIGASMGGFEALRLLVAGLPAGIDATIFVVWHLSPDSLNLLPEVLGRENTIAAAPAVNMESVMSNRIYTAPPDRHLVLDGGFVRVTRGPKENRFRPSIDVLFRSTALTYGRRVIGVILSGGLDDGVSGLWMIKKRGGIAIVQDPAEAEVPSMPRNAIRNVEVDHVLPITSIGPLLGRLTAEELPEKEDEAMSTDERSRDEVRIAIQDDLRTKIESFGRWSPLTCPECHGALAVFEEGGRKSYRCHTGHAFSVDSLLDALTESIEDSLYGAIRAIKENVLLLNHIGDHFAERNKPGLAARFFQKAIDAEARMEMVWQAAQKSEHINMDSIREEEKDEQSRETG